MPNPKKKIVLNEILYWKQNRLLPDHYCDFLMTLYSEGNGEDLVEEISHKKSIIATENKRKWIFSIGIIVISLALLVALFTVTKWVGLVSIFVSIIAVTLLISAFLFSKKQVTFAPLLPIGAALLIFGLSVKVSIEYFPDNSFVLYGLLIANCLIWLFTGLKLKLLYFTLSGGIGLMIVLGYQFFI